MGEQKRRMLAGEPFQLVEDPDLRADLVRSNLLVADFNATRHPMQDWDRRVEILRELLGDLGEDSMLLPPIHVNYGYHTRIGARTFANVGIIILDVAPVTIGDDVRIGPGVQLLTPVHPLDPDERRTGVQSAKPITIGDNAWLGGGVIVCPGVTIGPDAVIGAGSVVTKDVPPRVIAAGNPCTVVRTL